jgi:hypothetical protein
LTENSTQPQAPSAAPLAQLQAQEKLEQAQAALAQAQEKALGFIRENPVPCLVGGLVAGYLLGRLARSRWLNPDRR